MYETALPQQDRYCAPACFAAWYAVVSFSSSRNTTACSPSSSSASTRLNCTANNTASGTASGTASSTARSIRLLAVQPAGKLKAQGSVEVAHHQGVGGRCKTGHPTTFSPRVNFTSCLEACVLAYMCDRLRNFSPGNGRCGQLISKRVHGKQRKNKIEEGTKMRVGLRVRWEGAGAKAADARRAASLHARCGLWIRTAILRNSIRKTSCLVIFLVIKLALAGCRCLLL